MFRPPCDSLIFDLDGTLWDASPTTASAWSEVASNLKIPVVIDEQSIKSVSGLPFDKCVEARFGDHAKMNPDLHLILDNAEKEAILRNGGRIYAGVSDGIKKLSQQYKLFLVSNCQDWYLDSFLKHSGLGSYFQDTLCFGQTGRSKRENIEEIIARNNLKKPIYIGDTHWDQEAAFFAGAKFIFAKFGFGAIKVSSPSVALFNELVSMMNGPIGKPEVTVEKLATPHLQVAKDFYLSVGYVQAVQSADKFYGAFFKNELIGLVRLAFEENCWVLRGMQLKPMFQLYGIGTRLINLLESDLASEKCYCLPHGWLDKFYGQIGFRTVTDMTAVPSFLVSRLTEYKKKYPQMILMARN